MSDDGNDDLNTAVSFLSQFLAQQQHTSQMLAAADSAAFTYRNRHNPESSDEEELQTKPGRSNTLFTKKANYVRREQSKFYEKVQYRNANTYLFKKITHLTASEIDALYDLVA
ncbi:hypothetical protein BWQ96_01855 [Gracilariopsis chorda]|uniref:Uncharacterized protein n=1 Tax=Gracilariopsis chorda TaxID=448386 RepID=A0A2V3J209_9FLOR|nr:hypothetical protein BWQ96_01855 [Gracilariopsis chorda]|eukprot:PXF48395.1 hypothetical protein BWQ96_01855 [Gracilariopsis chorda]